MALSSWSRLALDQLWRRAILAVRKERSDSIRGVFQSPQLLMVSGVGPASTLQAYNIPVVADLPGVG